MVVVGVVLLGFWFCCVFLLRTPCGAATAVVDLSRWFLCSAFLFGALLLMLVMLMLMLLLLFFVLLLLLLLLLLMVLLLISAPMTLYSVGLQCCY